jgi:hypothetical protein
MRILALILDELGIDLLPAVRLHEHPANARLRDSTVSNGCYLRIPHVSFSRLLTRRSQDRRH